MRDVISMDACHILFRRPRCCDKGAIHVGRRNNNFFLAWEEVSIVGKSTSART